ncbi:MAG: hypothetical protein ABIM98_03265 [candidate division WOR-3 bacterium]
MMEIFECKSCGSLIGIQGEKEPLFCPLCRGKMIKIELDVDLKVKIKCPECENIFFVKENFSPYKCAFCNFTFISSPFRKFEERL